MTELTVYCLFGQVLHEVDDLGLAQAGLLKVAVQSLIDSHAIAHDNTDPHAVTHLNQWDPDAAKSAIAAAHNSLTYLEASKEKVLAFQRNLTENVLRPLAALEEQYAAELLDGKEALQHQFAVAKELVHTRQLRYCMLEMQSSVLALTRDACALLQCEGGNYPWKLAYGPQRQS